MTTRSSTTIARKPRPVRIQTDTGTADTREPPEVVDRRRVRGGGLSPGPATGGTRGDAGALRDDSAAAEAWFPPSHGSLDDAGSGGRQGKWSPCLGGTAPRR